ncbi:MAG: HAD family hydrolase, partial [Aquificota bacterium]
YLEDFTKADEIPFDFQRKRLSILVRTKEGNFILITKGAYKNILEVCSYASVEGRILRIEELKGKIEEIYQRYSEQGYKVIALAYKDLRKDNIAYTDEREMIFGGFIVLHDPIKQDSKKTIQELMALGVDLRIVTGDNILVAKKFAKDLGLPEKIISGEELRKYPAEALTAIVRDFYVFAELDPMQKEDIVLALRRLGHVVGYMGDGANDLLAMRASDVALSVENAMDVVKESADIVFSNPDLAGIREAIVEGRRAFLNSMKYSRIQTSSNFGNMLSVLGASFLVPFIPLLPYQVLTLNLLADLSFLTLPSDNVDEEKLKKPTSWDLSKLKKFIVFFGPVSSIFDYATFFYAMHILRAGPDTFRSLWFLESLVTQSLVLLFLRTDKTAFLQSRPSKALVLTVLGVLSSGVFLLYSPFGRLLGLYPLGVEQLIFVFIVTLSYVFLVEMVKRLYAARLSN